MKACNVNFNVISSWVSNESQFNEFSLRKENEEKKKNENNVVRLDAADRIQ